LSKKGKAEPDAPKRLADLRAGRERSSQTDVGYMRLSTGLTITSFKPWVKGIAVNQQGYTGAGWQTFYVRMLTKGLYRGSTVVFNSFRDRIQNDDNRGGCMAPRFVFGCLHAGERAILTY